MSEEQNVIPQQSTAPDPGEEGRDESTDIDIDTSESDKEVPLGDPELIYTEEEPPKSRMEYPKPPTYNSPPKEEPPKKETAEDKIKKLQKECEDAKKECAIWRGYARDSSNEVFRKDIDIHIADKVKHTLFKEKDEEKRAKIIYRKRYKKVRRQRNQFHAERDQCWDELDEANEKNAALQTQIDSLKKQIKEMKQKMRKGDEEKTRFGNLKWEKEQLEKDLKEANKEIKTLRAATAQMKKAKDTFQEECKGQFDSLQKIYDHMNDALEAAIKAADSN